jgi:hypothetical protein
VDTVFSQSQDTSRFSESKKFDNRQPVEHRSDSTKSRDVSSEQDGPQVEQPLQNNFGGFRMSYPLHEFGSPFDSNFNRLDYNTPVPYHGTPGFKRPFNFPQYDSGEINFFKRPNKNFHFRHEYDDKDCKDDEHEEEKKTSFKGKGTKPREPNFHQRFDPGPDGFGPFGRRPQIIDHTDFFKRPEENDQKVKNTEHRAIADKEGDNQSNRGYNKQPQDERVQESQYGNPDDKSSQFTPLVNNNRDFNRFESSTTKNNEPINYFNVNRNANSGIHMRRFKDIPNKEFRHYNKAGIREEENDEVRSNVRESPTSDDENTSSQDQYSKHRAVAGWHPTRQRH